MKNTTAQTRRAFLKTSTLAATAFFIVPRYVLGRGYIAPSDRINIGFIGCGKQSASLQNNFLKTNQIEFIAAADVFKAKRERFIQGINKYNVSQGKEATNNCKAYHDFRELLQIKDIDAVIIAVPDHWHAAVAVRACNAGKDVYCEKPLSLTVAEGRAMVHAARKHDRIFQTGSMQRSWKEFRQAVELVRNGYIGEVKQIKVNIDGPPKAWDLQGEPIPEGLDWNFWLGPNTIERPYNSIIAPTIALEPSLWPQWRAYKEFGGGGMTDWGAHMFDIAQWGLNMDESGPVKVIAPADGAKVGLIYEYANGVQMIHVNEKGGAYCKFIGTNGEVHVGRGILKTSPETLKDKVIGDNEKHVYYSDNHYMDFLNSIRTRKKPICDVEVGHRTASVCNIGNIAYSLGRTLEWSPEREKFRHDSEANALLHRPMKKEWKV
jgi:predicted dehydrogenase